MKAGGKEHTQLLPSLQAFSTESCYNPVMIRNLDLNAQVQRLKAPGTQFGSDEGYVQLASKQCLEGAGRFRSMDAVV
jgi:hypothetical protein